MKRTITLSLSIVFIASMTLFAQSPRPDMTVEYGPPAEADVWEKFTIPLIADTFNMDPAEFEAAMANITSFWIRTEMHTGNDVGGIDNVMIGDEYMSDFNFSYEGWSSGGDGTMEWISSDGVEGGFLQISDWATGDWHWLIAPASWAGDWSSMIGEDIEFWYKTNRPSYSAIIKLTTGPINRLVINAPTGNFVPPNDSVLVEIEVTPMAEEDMTITFTSSDNSCITVPGSVTIPAGSSSAELYFTASPEAEEGCSSVIEAEYPGYISSRITMKAEDHSSVSSLGNSSDLKLFPNPTKGRFTVSNDQELGISALKVYSLAGNEVLEIENVENDVFMVDLTGQAPGMYFVKIFTADGVVTSKVLLEK